MQRLVFDVDGTPFPSIERQTTASAKPVRKPKAKKSKALFVQPSSRRPFSDGLVGAFVTT